MRIKTYDHSGSYYILTVHWATGLSNVHGYEFENIDGTWEKSRLGEYTRYSEFENCRSNECNKNRQGVTSLEKSPAPLHEELFQVLIDFLVARREAAK